MNTPSVRRGTARDQDDGSARAGLSAACRFPAARAQRWRRPSRRNPSLRGRALERLQQIEAASGSCLSVDDRNVILDRVRRDMELLADLLVRGTIQEKRKDLRLPPGQFGIGRGAGNGVASGFLIQAGD
jgi:hypothetical protein